MSGEVINHNGMRLCNNKGCTEVATRKVMVAVLAHGKVETRLAYLCEGHAFIAMGQYGDVKITECPCCHTMFKVEERKE